MAENEDELLWLETIKDIKPLPQVKTAEQNHKKNNIEVSKHKQYAVKQEFSSYSKDLADYEFGGIDAATLRKFKKEEFKIEAVLDLHGLKEEEAFERVDNFIVQCYNEGKRCIIIVTGKGGVHQNDDIFAARGILRKSVPQWLNLPRLRAMILVYKNPSERMGGQGALYILLRRNKELRG